MLQTTAINEFPDKKVTVIMPTKPIDDSKSYRQLRTAAYCRVSTDSDEQELSFESQVKAYTDKIMSNPEWSLVDIFADEGISGTKANNRKEFMRMMRYCRQGKIDQIITKSVSRFARNTVDCLEYIRELRGLGIPVIFEKEGINTMNISSEIYISMHSVFAQSESESLSGNVRWGIQKSAERGNVHVNYKTCIGLRKGPDGKPELDPEGVKVINFMGDCLLDGDSLNTIKLKLEEKGILTPTGKQKWSVSTILSILTNVRNKGDALLCKTYVVDCISKKTVKNTDRPQYYVHNCLPQIMEPEKFDRIQAELARRSSLKKKQTKNTTTDLGRYSSKYALTELLICGTCGTSYRRTIWSKKGYKKVVWRCINRMDYGKQYCPDPPNIEEYLIHNAIVTAIKELVNDDSYGLALKNLKSHIKMYYAGKEDKSVLEDEIRLNTLIDTVMNMAKTADVGSEEFVRLSREIEETKKIIAQKKQNHPEITTNEKRMTEIFETLESMKNTPIEYDDKMTRKLIDCIKVMSKNQLLIIFKGGIQKTIMIGDAV